MIAILAASLMAAPAAGLLSVHGPHLVFGGKRVQLRGVCVGDVVLARAGRPLADYRVLSEDWKANVVRIGVAPTSWRHAKARTWAALKNEVQAALDARLFVLIDWHTIGWPDGHYQIPTWEGTPKDLYDSDFALATDFWKACAQEYKGNGRVGFHLWCEPIFQEKDWELPMGSKWAELKPWFERLTATIRAEGAKNLLLATGIRWAYDLKGIRENPLKDTNTAYMWHVYAGHDNNDPKRWEAALDELHTVAPVVVSEWGFEPGSKAHYGGGIEEFGNPFLEFMERRGLHWTAWCWHNTWGPSMFDSEWKKTTEYGEFVRKALFKLNRIAVRP